MAADASALYARNLYNFIAAFWDKDAGLKFAEDDEIVKGVTPDAGRRRGARAAGGMKAQIVVLAIAAMAMPAAAGEPTLASTWQIVAQATDASPRTARSGDMLWQQPLVAAQVAVLSGDAADPKGKILLPSGTQLMKMASGDAEVFCDLNPRKAGAAEMMLLGSLGETATCLVDRDHDGRLDGHFTKKVQYEGVPIIRGGYPADPEAITPTSFTIGDTAGSSERLRGRRQVRRAWHR